MADHRASLEIRELHVYYGQSHAIQGVNLRLDSGVLSVVGRNGMGKTTLCNTIMGLTPARSGSIRVAGREIRGRAPHVIARLGLGYVPQGRRVWPSLSVDEHLRLAFRGGEHASWTIERAYEAFPHLADRRSHGGAQLSGGEQQMLAIARGLLGNPHLLIMDEPTEGLAPVIVEQVERILVDLADHDEFAVLLIEQNIGVATQVSENVAVMVNGRIHRTLPAVELASDTGLQQRLLGVGRHADEPDDAAEPEAEPHATSTPDVRVLKPIAQPGEHARSDVRAPQDTDRSTVVTPNRWGTNFPSISTRGDHDPDHHPATAPHDRQQPPLSTAEQFGRTALVAGTFDTKGRELDFMRDRLRTLGLRTRTVDLSTSGSASRTDVTPVEVASYHPQGQAAVFSGERGSAVTAMAQAFENWIRRQRDVGGIISAGGSGGTALATAAMRALPVGIPKVMISTVASGDVSPYVGPSDIMMMYSVADIQGINAISEQILSNGANALAGMIRQALSAEQRQTRLARAKPSIGITMFGLTTPCVQALTARLADYDCLVFHATGTGGRSMEKLADAGALAALIDVTTTEVADMLVGGVFAADEDRFGAVIRTRLPYIGSCGALDMVNFSGIDSLPEKFKGRKLQVHNAQVTLMRTTPEENTAIGRWIGERLNAMEGPVRFLLPEGGLSGIDAPDQPFYDPEANAALFDALEQTVLGGSNRKLIRVPAHINDTQFVDRLVDSFFEINIPARRRA